MIHLSAKHQIVGVPLRPELANLFPSAKTVTYEGTDLILLPHGVEVTRLLRNLGFEVPAPIATHYDWEGGTPFDVQIKTAALLTTQHRAYVLNGMGCVDADTEYLSPKGWVRIANYAGGEVAQYVPSTGRIEFVEPTQYVKLACPEMIRLKTKYGIDQLLSPEHRVLLRSAGNGDKREVCSAEELLHRHDVQHMARTRAARSLTRIAFSQAAIPATFSYVGGAGVGLPEPQLRLQVAVIADGHFPCGTNSCVMRLKRPRKIARIRQLLQSAGVPFKETQPGPTRTDHGYCVFNFVAPLRVKEFGPEFWNSTESEREIIADEVLHWDGSSVNGSSFHSTSKASADFVQFVFASLGRTARIVLDQRDYGTGGPCYTVIVRDNGRPLMLKAVTSTGNPLATMWREPSTDGFKYCFMVPSTFLLFRRNGCVFASGNTGKTKAALWSFRYLQRQGLAGKALVVAPLSTLHFTWAREVFNTLPGVTYQVLHGTKAKRLERLESDADIYIINHDGLGILADEIIARSDIDTLILDELAVYRNGTSARTKVTRKVAAVKRWVWGMTGSPTPSAPTDAWSQCSIITPTSVPKYFSRFRDDVMTKVSNFRWVPKKDALDTVLRAMQPAVRYTLDDVVELPDLVERTVDIELGAKQKRVYEQMERSAHVAVQAKEITAMNAGAVLSKLLQISTGYVYTREGEVVPLDNEARLDALVEAIEGSDKKVLVFVPFKHALAGISERLTREGIDHRLVSGDTPKGERDELFRLFQMTESVRVIVAHPQCMAHGLTLTAASTIIWFAPIPDLEIFEQANARIRRVGQKNKQLVLMFQATKAERQMYAKLRSKQKVQNLLLDLFATTTD